MRRACGTSVKRKVLGVEVAAWTVLGAGLHNISYATLKGSDFPTSCGSCRTVPQTPVGVGIF